MSLEGHGPNSKNLVRARPIEEKFGLTHLRIRAGLLHSTNSVGRVIQPSPITHNEVGEA